MLNNKVVIKVVGGEPPSNAVLSSKLSPYGVNPKKAGDEIKSKTSEYTNIRLFVKLHIQTREIKQVEVMPMCSSLIIKDLKEPIRKKRAVKAAVYKHSGNLTFQQVQAIAHKMVAKSMAKTFKGTVKEVLGTWYIDYLVLRLELLWKASRQRIFRRKLTQESEKYD